jgi:hypothetical protein
MVNESVIQKVKNIDNATIRSKPFTNYHLKFFARIGRMRVGVPVTLKVGKGTEAVAQSLGRLQWR